jgi:ABC-type Fe3+ transport system substrate-binding protein
LHRHCSMMKGKEQRMKRFAVVCLAVMFASAIGVPVRLAGAQDADWQKVLAAGKKEGVVNAASTALSGKAAVKAMNAFKEQYGISLELIPGRIATATEKIMVEQKSKSYTTDSMDAHSLNIVLLKNAGYLESVVKALPAMKEKDKFVRPLLDKEDKDAQLLNILYLFTNFWINTDLVKPGEEPKSWHDLLDPKWKGKIALMNPLFSSAPEEVMLAFGKADKSLDENYFVKLYKNAMVGGPGGADEAMDKVVRGEAAICGFVVGGTALKPFLAGAPIKPLDLKEGTMFKPVKWAMIKNAPHPNATKVYINGLLSKEGQALVSDGTGLESIRSDVPSTMPFRFHGPTLNLTYEQLVMAADRYTKKHMANLLGLKK